MTVDAAAFASQGWRFVRASRAMARRQVTAEEATTYVSAASQGRSGRFLRNLDALVWPHPTSPARRLLEWAGLDRRAVIDLVESTGLEGALEQLRDGGVHVSYEESLGQVPARRGSATFDFRPEDFSNPCVRADYLTATSGSRSGGTPARSNFAYMRRNAIGVAVELATWGVHGAPSAVWMPAFPGGGLGMVLQLTAAGNPPDRWFSQIPLDLEGVASRKRAANRILALGGRVLRTWPPPPEFAPMSDPDTVLGWAEATLAAHRRAYLLAYTSSAARLGLVAADRRVSLDGLVILVVGEPFTPAKIAAVGASGASVIDGYGFVPEAVVACTCPESGDLIHLWDHELALITRDRQRLDGETVKALCWTSLAEDAPRVLLNVENDDYGVVSRDETPCSCLMGRLGMRTRIAGIRGMSKVVAAGINVPGEVFVRLAEVALPSRFGGGPTDFQFVEEECDGSTAVVLRIDPRLGDVDADAALRAVQEALRESEAGLVAEGVWGASLRVARAAPRPTRGGKVLAYEPLPGRLTTIPPG